MQRQQKYSASQLSDFAGDIDSLKIELGNLSVKRRNDLLSKLMWRSAVGNDIKDVFYSLSPKVILQPGCKPQNFGKYKNVPLFPSPEMQPVYVYGPMGSCRGTLDKETKAYVKRQWSLAVQTALALIESTITASNVRILRLFGESVIRSAFSRWCLHQHAYMCFVLITLTCILHVKVALAPLPSSHQYVFFSGRHQGTTAKCTATSGASRRFQTPGHQQQVHCQMTVFNQHSSYSRTA